MASYRGTGRDSGCLHMRYQWSWWCSNLLQTWVSGKLFQRSHIPNMSHSPMQIPEQVRINTNSSSCPCSAAWLVQHSGQLTSTPWIVCSNVYKALFLKQIFQLHCKLIVYLDTLGLGEVVMFLFHELLNEHDLYIIILTKNAWFTYVLSFPIWAMIIKLKIKSFLYCNYLFVLLCLMKCKCLIRIQDIRCWEKQD